jgi:hypothetical protein
LIVREPGDKVIIQVAKGCHPLFFTICLRFEERQDSDVEMVLQQARGIIRERLSITSDGAKGTTSVASLSTKR